MITMQTLIALADVLATRPLSAEEAAALNTIIWNVALFGRLQRDVALASALDAEKALLGVAASAPGTPEYKEASARWSRAATKRNDADDVAASAREFLAHLVGAIEINKINK